MRPVTSSCGQAGAVAASTEAFPGGGNWEFAMSDEESLTSGRPGSGPVDVPSLARMVTVHRPAQTLMGVVTGGVDVVSVRGAQLCVGQRGLTVVQVAPESIDPLPNSIQPLHHK